ncbi:MAG: choice-of-anchor J domain-containing protein, partial [Ignavibacteria bacterium]
MNRTKATLFGMLVVVLGIALGFSTMKDDPKKGNPTDSRKNESINPIQQDGPIAPIGGYDTDGTPYYTDNFDGANDTTALKTRGYFVWYRGTGAQGLGATWFQGNPAVFSAFNGPTSGYVGANFQVVTGLNNIDSWLITP